MSESCCIKPNKSNNSNNVYTITKILLFVILSIFLLFKLEKFSNWLIYDVLKFDSSLRISAAIQFFIFETPKVLILLALIVFAVGIVRTFFTPERTRKILSGKKEFTGNVLAALLGVVTPFCSCSAIPLFIGFVTTGVPLGVTFSFLISAPMVNEVALVLLFGLFGWKIALLYMSTGLFIAILSGWVIGKLKLEKYVEEWVYKSHAQSAVEKDKKLTWQERVSIGFESIKEIVYKVWPYLVAGIAIGSFVHGYVPENYLASIMGKNAFWSVPIAVLIGIPLYSNAAGIIPIVQSLLEKGAALGTVLAFMMAVIGLSLPEMVILRKVLKLRLILIFIGVVGFGILIVGYIFNLVF
ncbi:MAG: permease [Proteobacteria bacterium]|nr:permease [Pseudomonadota bacterium]